MESKQNTTSDALRGPVQGQFRVYCPRHKTYVINSDYDHMPLGNCDHEGWFDIDTSHMCCLECYAEAQDGIDEPDMFQWTLEIR